MYYYPEDNYYVPAEPDETHVYVCDHCGNSIYEAEEYYLINDEKWCGECIKNASRLA